MMSFLRDLARDSQSKRTVIVVDESGVAPPQQYRVAPRHLLGFSAGVTIALAVLLTAIVMLTPLRRVFLGPDPATLRETARINAIRATALEDSLDMQREYLAVIRATLTGAPDSVIARNAAGEEPLTEQPSQALEYPIEDRSSDWGDHEPPGLALTRMDASPRPALLSGAADAFIAGLLFPAMPPLEGFFARGFDASRGHFGIDIAVEEDTPVRAIGDGYVVFADWTNDGGYTVAVQHADGYLSVYKHNKRLLKRVGDRVRARESIARSGNTGEITTGPHLHFELWRNGFAQDPRQYLVGL